MIKSSCTIAGILIAWSDSSRWDIRQRRYKSFLGKSSQKGLFGKKLAKRAVTDPPKKGPTLFYRNPI